MMWSFRIAFVYFLLSFPSLAGSEIESFNANLVLKPNRISVSAQIKVADVILLKERGFRAIINNRPDGEEPWQPMGLEIRNQAEALGLQYFYIPVSPSGITPENINDVLAALRETSGPVLAYCRSGARSERLKVALQIDLNRL